MYLSEIISEDVKHKYRMSPSQSLYLSLMRTILKKSLNKQEYSQWILKKKQKQKQNTPSWEQKLAEIMQPLQRANLMLTTTVS